MNIKDKVVIITGASSGIGEATARLLFKHQAKVVLAARSKEKLVTLSKTLPGTLVVLTDMRKEDEISNLIKKTIKHFGRVDILINNAGRGYDAMVENVDTNKFRELFALNLVGPTVAIKEVVPYMRKQGGGVIINISSGTALMSIPGMSPYSSLKRALVGISLTAREELIKDKIIVSVVYPYITLTDFEKNTMKDVESEETSLPPMQGDSPDYIAQKILDAIKSGKAEIFAHEWMEKPQK